MVLRFLFRILRRDQGSRDSSPSDSPPPTSQGGSGIGARADVARKTKEAEHMLANLEKEGVKIDDRIASIIDDEVARIKVEAARENINVPKRDWMILVRSVACIAIGFVAGADYCEQAINAAVAKKILYS